MDTLPPPNPVKQRGRPPGRRRAAEGDAATTRREIVQRAAELLMERGYSAVSVDEIAHAANVTTATLYYHFRGKSDLFVATVETFGEQAQQGVAALFATEHLSVPERVRQFVAARRERDDAGATPPFGTERFEQRVRETFSLLSPAERQRVEAAFAPVRELVLNLMTQGVRRGELRQMPPEVLGYAFWHLFDSSQYPVGEHLSRRVVDDCLVEIFLRGVMPERMETNDPATAPA